MTKIKKMKMVSDDVGNTLSLAPKIVETELKNTAIYVIEA